MGGGHGIRFGADVGGAPLLPLLAFVHYAAARAPRCGRGSSCAGPPGAVVDVGERERDRRGVGRRMR